MRRPRTLWLAIKKRETQQKAFSQQKPEAEGGNYLVQLFCCFLQCLRGPGELIDIAILRVESKWQETFYSGTKGASFHCGSVWKDSMCLNLEPCTMETGSSSHFGLVFSSLPVLLGSWGCTGAVADCLELFVAVRLLSVRCIHLIYVLLMISTLMLGRGCKSQ